MINFDFVTFLYSNCMGRIILKIIQSTGLLKLTSHLLCTDLSKIFIHPYIKKHHIDMNEYVDQNFETFQDFFSRTRSGFCIDTTPNHLISPCDGFFSFYPIRKDSVFCIKDSWYKLTDLIPDKQTANLFINGDCLIFRLTPSDYHRYLYIDDGFQGKNNYIEGKLHSVQPIACDSYPVYRLNRRVWTLLNTDHFEQVAQIEVGALLVGGIINHYENTNIKRGDEMGYFDLAGSTIILLFQRKVLSVDSKFAPSKYGHKEIRVRLGETIGYRNT